MQKHEMQSRVKREALVNVGWFYLVVNFSLFLKLFIFCFVVAMGGLVHDLEALYMAYVNC